MHDMQTATIEVHKGLIATAERGVAKGEPGERKLRLRFDAPA